MRPPESWQRARATLAIAAATAVAWFIPGAIGYGEVASIYAGFIPARFAGFGEGVALVPLWLTPLTATLVHASWAHILSNLIILLFCGRSVENILGPLGLVILYVVGAYVAAGAQYLVDPLSEVPMVGASGAVAALIGAYALLFGRNKVKVADPRLALALHVLWLAAAWVILQIAIGLTFETIGMSIAVAAHVGGFFLGVALVRPLLLLRYRKA